MAGALVAVAREEHRNLQQWSDEELEASEARLAFEGQGRWRWTWEQRHNFLVEKKGMRKFKYPAESFKPQEGI